MNVSFGDNADGSPTSSEAPQQRKVDEATALQTLYMLDRFGVSDEFYHELTQVRYYDLIHVTVFHIHVHYYRFTPVYSEAML